MLQIRASDDALISPSLITPLWFPVSLLFHLLETWLMNHSLCPSVSDNAVRDFNVYVALVSKGQGYSRSCPARNHAVCPVPQSCPALCGPMGFSLQAPLSMGFSRQEYWSGLPCPRPGDLPNSGTKPRSPALQADSLLSEPQSSTVKPCSTPHMTFSLCVRQLGS